MLLLIIFTKSAEWNNQVLSPAALEAYADVIYRKGAALENCFGFIDGTVRPICRPGQNQRSVYNGHKRVHVLKFQSVTLPNGLIGNLYGPVGKIKQFDLLMLLYMQLMGFRLLWGRLQLLIYQLL